MMSPFDKRTHLEKKTPLFGQAIQHLPTLSEIKTNNYGLFVALFKIIISQQISNRLAQKIWQENFIDQIDQLTPEFVLNSSDDFFKSKSISSKKILYIRSLALFFFTDPFIEVKINAMNTEEIIDYFTQINGIGRWSVEMLLIFELGYLDVFPMNDLIIKKQMIKIFKLEYLDSKEQMIQVNHLSQKFSPYKTEATRYLWELSKK